MELITSPGISPRRVLRYERCRLGVEVSLSQAALFPPEDDDNSYLVGDKKSADMLSARVEWTTSVRATPRDRENVDD